MASGPDILFLLIAKILFTVPTSSPVIKSVETVDSTSLKVNWSPLSLKNGKATWYTIKVQCLTCHGIFAKPKQFKKGPGGSVHAILNGLSIYSKYSVQIAAMNKFGQGNFSNPVVGMTDETGRLLLFICCCFCLLNLPFFDQLTPLMNNY